MTEIITQDLRMKELITLAKTVAQSKATVLIQGESGTGKEKMAELIHTHSNRAQRPFIAINCAAIPENLLESELFGYERGAFTGAVSAKAGKFELAHGGTLLLDEVSEMDIRLQAKLLRAIQEGEIDRIGGKAPITVDVRIVATTNRKLSECVLAGSFREDLFYRLNVICLNLLPLRERVGDIALLARLFSKQQSAANQKLDRPFNTDSILALESYTWPGNIRELENVIERAVITAQGPEIQSRDIHLERKEAQALLAQSKGEGNADSGWKPGRTMDEIEKNVILSCLGFHDGNRTHTAKALGISIRTLRNKLADYRRLGLDV